MSSLINIPSGVFHRSHLNPLLFILLVNSINRSINETKFLLFVGDIKMYLNSNYTSCFQILQSQLDKFTLWVQRLCLRLNLAKCHVMTFSRRHNPTFYSYHINGSPLERVFINKNLGIHFTPSLNFNHHINVTVCKALNVLGFIKRNTKMFSSIRCHCILYFSLVRSILEFGVIVWHPYLAKDQLRL